MTGDLKIITLESLDGVGISTQVRLLNQQLTQLGYSVKTFKFQGVKEATNQASEINDFLAKIDRGIIINDGSFAKAIANDMLEGYSSSKLEDKYKDILYIYECLNHQYTLLNIVLLPDNAETGQKRYIKHAEILGKECEVTEDLNKQKDMLKLLGQLDNHVITRSIKFDTLDIYEDDKILDINDKLWKFLSYFDIKKPSI